MDVKCDDVYIEITKRCNQECVYCMRKGNASEDMNMDIFKRIVDDIQDYRLGRMVRISGGEPFLHNKIDEVFKELAVRHIKSMILTNGTIPLYPYEEYLVSDSILLQISLDSLQKEVHERYRGKGTYDHVRDNMNFIDKLGINKKVSIAVTLMKNNMDGIADLIHFAGKKEYRLIVFNMLKQQGRAKYNDMLDEEITEGNLIADLEDTIHQIKARYPKLEIEYQFRNCGGCRFFNNPTWIMPRIDADGKVYPCRGLDDPLFCIGDLTDSRLSQILYGERLERLLTSFFERKANSSACKVCRWSAYCRGGCISDYFELTGDIDLKKTKICDRIERDIINQIIKKRNSKNGDFSNKL